MSAVSLFAEVEKTQAWAGISAVEAMFKHESLICLKQDLNSDRVAISEPVCKSPIYGSRLGVLLLACPEITVTLKAFFNFKDVRKILEIKFGRKMESDANNLIYDYVREFLNRLGGQAKRRLGDSGINVGISLPIVTRGFDEVFNAEAKGNLQTVVVWAVGAGDVSLAVTAALVVKNGMALGSFVFTPEESNDDDNMEFL